jgi:heterodisulfide reductase subunit A-like polyferredoxin
MVSVSHRKNIKLMTYHEVVGVSGYIGNYKVRLRRKARYVDPDKCTGCGQCWSHCPSVRIPTRRTIRLPDKTVGEKTVTPRAAASAVEVPVGLGADGNGKGNGRFA